MLHISASAKSALSRTLRMFSNSLVNSMLDQSASRAKVIFAVRS